MRRPVWQTESYQAAYNTRSTPAALLHAFRYYSVGSAFTDHDWLVCIPGCKGASLEYAMIQQDCYSSKGYLQVRRQDRVGWRYLWASFGIIVTSAPTSSDQLGAPAVWHVLMSQATKIYASAYAVTASVRESAVSGHPHRGPLCRRLMSLLKASKPERFCRPCSTFHARMRCHMLWLVG